jgi:hypothetical protein
MPDLFTWLTARYIEEHSAGASPAASDAALQWMELQLEASGETGADERYLLEQYLGLLNDELQALPAPVHEWFLERWALAGPGTDDPARVSEIADRIAAMYLMAGPGTYQAAVVAALLAFDQHREQGPSHVTRVWDLIGRSVPAEAQRSVLAPLVEALLDLVYLTAQPAPVLRALGDIARRDAQTHFAMPLMRERITLVGESAEGPLSRLLTDFES